MGVPSDQLGRDVAQGIADVEAPVVGLELGQEDALEKQIADFASECIVIRAVDRVEHFVGFFEDEWSQRVNRLLAIPWAATGTAESAHDIDEALELTAGRVAARRWRFPSLQGRLLRSRALAPHSFGHAGLC